MSEFICKFKKEQGKEFRPDFIYEYSRQLAEDYPKYIAEWWDKKKYNWFWAEYLAKYCSSNILTWFDKSKIDIWDLDPKAIVLLKKHNLI